MICALEGCGEEFEPKRHNQKYCSPAHAQKAYNLSRTRTRNLGGPRPCANPECDNTVKPTREHPEKKYCSRSCKERAATIKGRRGDAPAKPDGLSDQILLEEMSKRGYHVDVPTHDAEGSVNIDISRFTGERLRWGVVSDTHLCSKFQQLTHLRSFYRLCSRREIDTVIHGGDIVDGQGVYKGQEYETFLFGLDAQVDYACEHYPEEPGITTYFIEGNHDFSFQKLVGAKVGERITAERPDLRCIGQLGAYMNFGALSVYVHHPDAGGAYALSYKPQKIVENFTPENKPHIVFMGHYHRACYLPGYRNVETLMLPAFQGQTPYLKRKGIQPVVAGAFVEVAPDSRGMASMSVEMVLYQEHMARDY